MERRLQKKVRKLRLLAIFFTFFVDNLSWAIVFPVFAPYFLNPDVLHFPDLSVAARTALLGVFLSAVPLGQFFGAPIIGEFADKNGRRKALLCTISLTSLGFFLSAFAMEYQALVLLFFSRLLSGLFSGNLSICLAAAADLSTGEKERVKHFGSLAVCAGTAFILGAFLGGKFSDTALSPLFSIALPFWIGAGITLVNLVFVACFFQESYEKKPDVHFHFLESFHQIKLALQTENIKTIYLIYLLFLIAWNLLMQFAPVIAVNTFAFSPSELGMFIAFVGVSWAVGAGIISKLAMHYISPRNILLICLSAFSALCFTVVFAKTSWLLVLNISLAIVFSAVSWPICTNIISQKAGNAMQGKVLGVSQSMQSFAMAISPLFAVLTFLYLYAPFLLASFAALAALVLFYLSKVR